MISLAARTMRFIKRQLLGPSIRVAPRSDLIRLGSAYGGWTLVDTQDLQGTLLLSLGLGEDASFDIEFASRFSAGVVICDPTPRAVEHFDQIQTHLGQGPSRGYVDGGKQPVDSYDLSRVTADQINLVARAVADRSGSIRFYAPSDPEHVSHSIINFQNSYSSTTPHIEVEAIAAAELLELVADESVSVVKMDIEGAETLVLPQLLDTGFHPQQILVEFDELNFPSRRATATFQRMHGLLLESGYEVTYWDHRSCVSYMHRRST